MFVLVAFVYMLFFSSRRRHTSCALVTGVQTCALPISPGAPDPSRVVAGTYNVDSDHTQVLFTVTHLGFSTYTGMFVAPTGTLTIDPKNPSAAKVDITFPIAKVVTTATGQIGRAHV